MANEDPEEMVYHERRQSISQGRESQRTKREDGSRLKAGIQLVHQCSEENLVAH